MEERKKNLLLAGLLAHFSAMHWVDPKEELTAVYMSQAPSPIRAYYRKLVKQLAYGALTD